jgi:thymidylate synthase
MKNLNWPIYYKNVLIVNNPQSPVSVAVMWTERQVVNGILKNCDFNIIGNLYSSAGISTMIRNIYANPVITRIILWGADLSRSGQALLEFMKNGVDENNFIIGDEKKGQIEPDINTAAINKFRKSVEIINLRGKSPNDLINIVKKSNKLKSKSFSKSIIFPVSKPSPRTLPSEQVGFRAHGDTVAQAWLHILDNILRYGRNKETRYTKENDLKELLNVMAVVYNDDPENYYLPHFLPFTKKDLDAYYPQVMSAKKIPGISYTYGQRLRENSGVDQINEIIKLIKTRPFSKKMVAFTANIKEDWGSVNKGDTPCLTQILCSIEDNKLFLTAHFRSQDMVHGWPRNIFSLRKLQKLIGDETGYEIGATTTITHSAHIYSDDYGLVEEILKNNLEKELGYTSREMFEEDKRGNIVITIEDNYIVVKLFAPNGGLLLRQWRGKTAMDVYIQMINIGDYLVLPSHLIYIGTELQRAEYAIKNGQVKLFSQDPAANKKL